MFSNQLNRLVRFVQEHHERLVILDPVRDEPVVVLPFAEYELMKEPRLTPVSAGLDWDDDELWNESWEEPTKDSVSEEEVGLSFDEPAVAPNPSPAPIPQESETALPAATPEADSSVDDLTDIPHEEEEEKFYLEPVE